jgi:hypothetical protein
MNTKRIFLLLILAAVFSTTLKAQNMVGTWKTASSIVINMDNTKTDITAMQLKQWPCMAEVQTIFDANGKQYMKSAKKCGPVDFNKLEASTWKMNGKTISITNASMPTPLGNTSIYTVDFSGNKAVLTHEYSAEEKSKLHSKKVKEVIITYQRV